MGKGRHGGEEATRRERRKGSRSMEKGERRQKCVVKGDDGIVRSVCGKDMNGGVCGGREWKKTVEKTKFVAEKEICMGDTYVVGRDD